MVTNKQMLLVIGVPLLWNAFLALWISAKLRRLNSSFDSCGESLHAKFDAFDSRLTVLFAERRRSWKKISRSSSTSSKRSTHANHDSPTLRAPARSRFLPALPFLLASCSPRPAPEFRNPTGAVTAAPSTDVYLLHPFKNGFQPSTLVPVCAVRPPHAGPFLSPPSRAAIHR
jgi:hypothetical protein